MSVMKKKRFTFLWQQEEEEEDKLPESFEK